MTETIIYQSGFQGNDQTVSIVIPYFNMVDFIDEAIQSAENQTYSNIEVIVVDDGSTCQKSKEKVESIKLKHGMVVRQENGGLSAARNTGIRVCSGAFVLPLDADDKLDPCYVEKCLPVLAGNDQIGVVYGETRLFGSVDKRLELGNPVLPDMLFANAVVATALFRKIHWEEFGGYKESMSKGLEDFEFWMNFHEKELKFSKVEGAVFFYRQTLGSMSRTENTRPENYRAMMMNIYNFHQDLYARHAGSIFERLVAREIVLQKLEGEKANQKRLFSLSLGGSRRLRFVLDRKTKR